MEISALAFTGADSFELVVGEERWTPSASRAPVPLSPPIAVMPGVKWEAVTRFTPSSAEPAVAELRFLTNDDTTPAGTMVVLRAQGG